MKRQILDHGYIELIETWGSDQALVEAARMSTGKGFLGWDAGPCEVCSGTGKAQHDTEIFELQDRPDSLIAANEHWGRTRMLLEGVKRRIESWIGDCKACGGSGKLRGDAALLKYLWDNNHASPFEFGGMVIEVKAPIMVYREWHRHRSQGYNEASARYEPLPDDNYMPSLERLMLGGGHLTKQAGAAAGAAVLTEPDALVWLTKLADVYDHAESVYQDGLKIGIPKELARLPVPVGRYSKMRATTNLRMWLAFMTLRSTAKNPHAQWEIRQYADAVGGLLGENFPRTMALFNAPKG